MGLFKEWQDLIGNQTDDTFQSFWDDYSQAETKIYSDLLADYPNKVSGTVKELYERFDVKPVLFLGFLDGINSSLKEEAKLEEYEEDTQISLDIDMEKLYFNMHAAGADYLYNLPQWDAILTTEKRQEIEKAYKKSKTVVKEKTPGRNDPCPCGSGKKYKKCCGAN